MKDDEKKTCHAKPMLQQQHGNDATAHTVLKASNSKARLVWR